jgi:hypothetical protein
VSCAFFFYFNIRVSRLVRRDERPVAIVMMAPGQEGSAPTKEEMDDYLLNTPVRNETKRSEAKTFALCNGVSMKNDVISPDRLGTNIVLGRKWNAKEWFCLYRTPAVLSLQSFNCQMRF